MQFNYYNTRTHILPIKDNTLVPVIASYDTLGRCFPLYFRYTEEDGTSIKIKIDKILFTKPNSIFGTIYCCQVTVNQGAMTVYLFHHQQENKWYLRDHS